MIQLDQVTKQYGDVTALDGLSLTIAAEETTALIGPSGCGKSTILRLIIGLVQPDAGTVRFDGRIVEPTSVRQQRIRMGYVIQDGGLFPHLTARRNAALMASQLGWSDDAIEQRLRDLSELVKLPFQRLVNYPSQLSGGQRQRVSLMRALMLDPDVLLLDEPLGALDPMIRTELQEDLSSIFRRLGKTVVLVTHDIGEAAFFADRIVLMRKGTMVQQGAPAELIRHPAEPFVEAFIRAQRPPWTFDEEGASS